MIAVESAPVLSVPARKQNDWITPEALRTLIKSNLGYNARQVTVSVRSSNRYLQITIRDPQVDAKKVKAFAATFDTMTMDQSDYVEGQSVDVELTSKVKDAMGAPFITEISCIARTLQAGYCHVLSNGKTIWNSTHGFYVSNGQARGSYIGESDANNLVDWAIKHLAYCAATV